VSNPSFFDCNCQIHRYNARPAEAPYDLATLRDDLAYYGIDEALVFSAVAKEAHPTEGNDLLIRELQGEQRCHPCWCVFPGVSDEFPPPDDLLAAMQSAGVRAARFCPHQTFSPVAEWCMGPYWYALESARLPVIVDFGVEWPAQGPTDYDGLFRLCRAHPNLPVILTNHRLRHNRPLYRLLELCPNLRIETGCYWHYRGLEDIAQRFGPERLVFGSNWPHQETSQALGMLAYADIGDQQRALIAGDNLRALLEEVPW